MKNLKITLGTLLLTLSVNFTMAQTIEEKAAAQTEQMDIQLGLASDQKANIAALNHAILSKIESIKNDPNMSEDLKKQSIDGNHEGRMDMLREILTPEQFDTYKASEESAKKPKEKIKGNNLNLNNFIIVPASEE